jgi:hypothetical protein
MWMHSVGVHESAKADVIQVQLLSARHRLLVYEGRKPM